MSKKIFFELFILTLILSLITGCAQPQGEQPAQKEQQIQQQQQEQQIQEQPETKTFSIEELAMHSTKEDCWLLIHGKIYNVTKMIGGHPGGAAILEGCGKDATTFFETRPMGSGTPHSEKARDNLAKFYIGDFQG